MNGYKPVKSAVRPRKPRTSKKAKNWYPAHKAVALEISAKLLISWLLSVAAIASLIKLLPYHDRQQAQLKEIRTEVSETERRVERLRKDFSDNFSTQPTTNLMQQYSPRLLPNGHPVYFLPKNPHDRVKHSED